jgi:hypothetical protein
VRFQRYPELPELRGFGASHGHPPLPNTGPPSRTFPTVQSVRMDRAECGSTVVLCSVPYSTVRYGTAHGINTIPVLYRYVFSVQYSSPHSINAEYSNSRPGLLSCLLRPPTANFKVQVKKIRRRTARCDSCCVLQLQVQRGRAPLLPDPAATPTPTPTPVLINQPPSFKGGDVGSEEGN